MKHFFDYGGRGDERIAEDTLFQLDSEAGGIFLITQTIGKTEFIKGYCRSAIVEKWGCYCMCTFRRVSNVDLSHSWAEPMESELMIFHAVAVYLVPEEEWMRHSN
jgi:hypothetical protein